MRLYHFSDDPGIVTFVPRAVLVPSQRTPGREWLNGPLVWAIEDDFDFLYHFPRECPRILIWATEATLDSDRATWLGSRRAAAYVERSWLSAISEAVLQRYELPADHFENLGDAGMWVSREVVKPLARVELTDLPSSLASREVELRVVDSLVPLKALWATSLHTSGIRLRNASGW